jgi:hypothetical protein
MTNAIAWEMFKGKKEKRDGVEIITISEKETAQCKRAAERAYRQGIEGKD